MKSMLLERTMCVIVMLFGLCYSFGYVRADVSASESTIALDVRCYRIAVPMPKAVIDTIRPHFQNSMVDGKLMKGNASWVTLNSIELFTEAISQKTIISASDVDWSGDELRGMEGVELFEAPSPISGEGRFSFSGTCNVSYMRPLANGRYKLTERLENYKFSVGLSRADDKRASVQIHSIAPVKREGLPGVSLPVGPPSMSTSLISLPAIAANGKWHAILVYETETGDAPYYALVFVRTTHVERQRIATTSLPAGPGYSVDSRILRYRFGTGTTPFDSLPIDSEHEPIRGRANFVAEVPDAALYGVEHVDLMFPNRVRLSTARPESKPGILFKMYMPYATDGYRFGSDFKKESGEIPASSGGLGGGGGVGALSTYDMSTHKLPQFDFLVARPVVNDFLDDLKPAVTFWAVFTEFEVDGPTDVPGSEAWRLVHSGPAGTLLAFSAKADPVHNDLHILDLAYSNIAERIAIVDAPAEKRKVGKTRFPSLHEFRFHVPVHLDKPVAFTYIDDVTGDRVVIIVTLSFSEPK